MGSAASADARAPAEGGLCASIGAGAARLCAAASAEEVQAYLSGPEADVDAVDGNGHTLLQQALYARVPDGVAAGEFAEKRAAAIRCLFGRGGHRGMVEDLLARMQAFVNEGVVGAHGDNSQQQQAPPPVAEEADGKGPAPDGTDGPTPVGASPAAHASAIDDAFCQQILARHRRRVRGVTVGFIDDAAPRVPLVEWVRGLSAVDPPLGYTEGHVGQILATAREVVEREAVRLRAVLARAGGGGAATSDDPPGSPAVEEWMAALSSAGGDAGFDLFLAGTLYTMDLVDAEGKTLWCADDAILRNRGIDVAALRAQQAREGDGDFKGVRLPLYAAMNTAMREAPGCLVPQGDGAAAADDSGAPSTAVAHIDIHTLAAKPPQYHLLRAFNPLIRGVDELVRVLPSCPTTVFRGIRVNVSSSYRVGDLLVWHAFTSTSAERAAAASFMGGDNGTFFTIISKDSAAPVAFCSKYVEERELLYTHNIAFRVMWKLSPTLLRMMGVGYDVVVMQEVQDGVAAPEVRLFKEVLTHAMGFAEGFLAGYVEGRVGQDVIVDEADALPLSVWLRQWLARGHRPRAARCLVGIGGSGKTSAAVAAMSWLLDPPAEWRNGAPEPQGPQTEGGMDAARTATDWTRVFPVFIPLPAVKGGVLTAGAIDTYVQNSFALSPQGLEALGRTYDVVLVMDSLDETGVRGADLRSALTEHSAASLLALNPWAARSCSVLLTVRDEFMAAHAVSVADLCGPATVCGYLQRFGRVDATAYILRVLDDGSGDTDAPPASDTSDPATSGDQRRPLHDSASMASQASNELRLSRRGVASRRQIAATLCELFPWAVGNPFVLSMLMANHRALRAQLGKRGRVDEVDVYEMYVRGVAGEGLEGDGTSTADEVLRVGEALACRMVATNTWEVPLADTAASVARVPGMPAAPAVRECMRRLPLRVDDWGDDASAVCFSHKTLAEYLAARRLWREAHALRDELSQRSFSKDTPNVVRFFAGLVAGGTDDYMRRVLPAHTALLARDEGGCAAANALALIARTRVALRGAAIGAVTVRNADLRFLVVSRACIRGARFEGCWLEGSEFNGCDLEGVVFEGCNLSGSLLPSMHHPAGAPGVAITCDGRRLASCSSDGRVHIWDAATGACLRAITTCEGCHELFRVAFTPDGGGIAACGSNGLLCLWDTATGDERTRFAGHDGHVHSVAASPDSAHLLSGGRDQTVRIWDATAGEAVRTLDGHTSAVHGVAWCPTGAKVVSCGMDRTVRIWAATGTPLHVLRGHTHQVNTVAVSPDGLRVTTGSRDQTVRVWDATAGKEVHRLLGHGGEIFGVTVSPDGSKVVSCGGDATVRVWDAVSGRQLQALEGHTLPVMSVAVAPNGAQILSGSRDGSVMVWDAASGQELQAHTGHTSVINRVAISADGHRVATCGQDRTVRLWDAATGHELQTLSGHSKDVRDVALSADAATIVSGGNDSTVRTWYAASGREGRTFTGHKSALYGVAIDADGKRIASCGWDKVVRLWNTASGQLMKEMSGHTNDVLCVDVSGNGAAVATCGRDRTVRVWDAATGRERAMLGGHTKEVAGVAISSDGQTVVSGGVDRVVRVWNVASKKEVRQLKGHADEVRGVALSADGGVAVSCGCDGSVFIWDVAAGRMVQNLEGHAGSVTAVAITADAQTIATCGADRTVRVWTAEAVPHHDHADAQETGSGAAGAPARRFYLAAVGGRPASRAPRFVACTSDQA